MVRVHWLGVSVSVGVAAMLGVASRGYATVVLAIVAEVEAVARGQDVGKSWTPS